MTWTDLLRAGVVELISTQEEESVLIAMKDKDMVVSVCLGFVFRVVFSFVYIIVFILEFIFECFLCLIAMKDKDMVVCLL
jgi:hypothetical protein